MVEWTTIAMNVGFFLMGIGIGKILKEKASKRKTKLLTAQQMDSFTKKHMKGTRK